ncbi:TonB-dependent receptor plug domain-containing protein, partial [Acinetobacter baumannii]
ALLAPLASADEAVATLPAVRVDAAGDVGFTARKASSSTLKSDLPLNETAQSVTVVTREQMDARGVQSLTDALQGVAGVVSGY